MAIEALKVGATDYVLKTRLSRLAPSVLRALREAKERAERKQAEKALRRSEAYLAEAQRLSRTGSFGWNVLTGGDLLVRRNLRIFEYDPADHPNRRVGIATNSPRRPGARPASHSTCLSWRPPTSTSSIGS